MFEIESTWCLKQELRSILRPTTNGTSSDPWKEAGIHQHLFLLDARLRAHDAVTADANFGINIALIGGLLPQFETG